MIFAFDRTDDRLTLRRPDTRWLSNGVDGSGDDHGIGGGNSGGSSVADAAHNLAVPTGFDRTDLADYVDERLGDAPPGPTLLTCVSQTHARGARRGPVEVVVTAGLSNPAVLPMDVGRESDRDRDFDGGPVHDVPPGPGTVNVFVGTDRALEGGTLVGLLATAVEAKAATLLDAAGVPGTTSDAVVVGCDPDGEPSAFAGSATAVGAATRACVREAVRASLASRYGDGGPPAPSDAEHGIVTGERAEVFEPR